MDDTGTVTGTATGTATGEERVLQLLNETTESALHREPGYCAAVCPARDFVACTVRGGTRLRILRAVARDTVLEVPLGSSTTGASTAASTAPQPAPKPLSLAQKMLLARRQAGKPATTAAAAPTTPASAPTTPAARATALCWRPDGRIVAAAVGTTHLALVAVDSAAGDAAQWETPRAPGSGPVVAMAWRQVPCSSSTGEEDELEGDSEGANAFPFVPGVLDVLFCLDDRGTLSLYAAGLFLVQTHRFRVPVPLAPESSSDSSTGTTTLFVPADMSAAVAAFWARREGVARLHAVPLAETLGRHGAGVVRAARAAWRVCACAQAVRAAQDTLAQHVARAQALWRARVAAHTRLLRDNALGATTPAADSAALLTAGTLSPALEQFLPADRRTHVRPLHHAAACAARTLTRDLAARTAALERAAAAAAAAAATHDPAAQAAARALADAVDAATGHATLLERRTAALARWLAALPADVGEALQQYTSSSSSSAPGSSTSSSSSAALAWPGVREGAEVHAALHATDALLAALAEDAAAVDAAVARVVAGARACRASRLACFREPPDDDGDDTVERACVLATAAPPRIAAEEVVDAGTVVVVVVVVGGTEGAATLAVRVAREMLPLRVVDAEPRAGDLAAALAPLRHDPACPALAPVPTTRTLAWTVSSPSAATSARAVAGTLPALLRGAPEGVLAWEYYRTPATVVALLAGAGPGGARQLVRLRVARDTLALAVAAAADVPPSAERLDVGDGRGLALVACATGQVLVFDLE